MMEGYPIGFGAIANDGRVGDESYYLNTCRDLRSSFQMVISNINLASKLYDTCEGKTEVIYRSYRPNDNTLWRTQSAKSYADDLKGAQDHRLWLYGLNEPNTGSPADALARNDWLTTLVHEICGAGRKLVVGNFASGSWQLSHIDAGLYDGLLRAIAQYPDRCLLGVHEYCAVFMPMTFDTIMLPNALRYREYVQPEKWLYIDNSDVHNQLPDYRATRLDWMYHLFRSSWLQHRAIALGLAPIGMVLTEYGTDRLQDIEAIPHNIYDYMKDNYGVPEPYAAPHGFYSNYRAWDYYFPDWSTSRALFEQLKWTALNYDPAWYKGILLFMWGYDIEFSPRGFNVAPDTELHNLMIADAKASRTNTDPPSGEVSNVATIDTLNYLRGDAGRVYDISYQFSSSGKQTVTTHIDGRRFFHVKGAIGHASEWEELWYDHDYIYRGTDISPGDGQLYQIYEDGEYGGRWLPRIMTTGQRHFTAPMVTFRFQSNGNAVGNKPPYVFPHWIELKRIYNHYTFDSGMGLNDVIELWGYLDSNGKPGLNFERYWYAKGYGLVAWQDPTKSWRSYISHIHPSGTTLERRQLSWLTLPDLPPLQEQPMEQYRLTANDSRWKEASLEPKATGSLRIRELPAVGTTPIAGTFNSIILVYSIPDYVATPDDGFTWYPIKFDTDPTLSFDLGTFDKVGWVRGDIGEVEFLPEEIPDPDPEPDPEQEKNYARVLIPMPEHLTDQTKANAFAERTEWLAKGLTLFDEGDESSAFVAHTLNWVATLYRNWNETLQNTDGIIIYEKEEEGE